MDALVARIDPLSPMAKKKDIDEDSKIGFLKEAVVGTKWGLRAKSMLSNGNTFQFLINALKIVQRKMQRNYATDQRMSGENRENFGKSLWKSMSGKGEGDEPRDTLFTGNPGMAETRRTPVVPPDGKSTDPRPSPIIASARDARWAAAKFCAKKLESLAI